MTGSSLSSVFSTLGTAFHGVSSPVLKSSPSTVHPCKTSTHLTAFQNRLANDLHSLIFSDEKCSYLSAGWLQQAVDVMCLSAYSSAEGLFPLHIRQALDLHQDCGKWLNRYLEDTISLLDVCNVVKNRISRIAHCQQFLQIAIHCFDRSENTTEIQILKARRALDNCHSLMKAEQKSELKKCRSLLKRMGQRSAAPVLGASSRSVGEFVGVMNTCKVTAVFVCSAVVAALSFEPTKRSFPLVANKSGSWPSACLNVHSAMKEEMEERESKYRASVLLVEMGMVYEAARRLYSLLDKFQKKKTFPLSKDDAFELSQEISRLKTGAYSLKEGMDALDKHMSDVFRSIMSCRMSLLDMVTYSQL
jgi:hypothetical protein